MSISALSSYFKNHAGLLLSDYITEMKMKKAMHLLEFSNLSIQEAGLSIGYLNVTSFSPKCGADSWWTTIATVFSL